MMQIYMADNNNNNDDFKKEIAKECKECKKQPS